MSNELSVPFSRDGSCRPYLVFLRAGRNTLHHRLLLEDPARNWDCVVNWWAERFGQPAADFDFIGGQNKLDGFSEFYSAAWNRCWRYRYVLLLDDDVYFEPGMISEYFRICDRYKLYLSQPALRWGTYYSHRVTLWNPASFIRSVSFVEVMTPCFAIAALERLLTTFRLSQSTYGIDWAWSSVLRDEDAIHVVDGIRVDHTKKIDLHGGALYQRMRQIGVSISDEMARIQAMYPPFGGMRTKARGHVPAVRLPGAAGDAVVYAADRTLGAVVRTYTAVESAGRRLAGDLRG